MAATEVSMLQACLLHDPTLLKAIREIPTPQNVKEVQPSLGLATYYRRYIKGFAAIAAPLHTLTKKDIIFHWTLECQEAFVKLKHLLTTAPITTFPDFNLPFWLYTGASTQGLGAILEQVQEGWERIICCASHTLSQQWRIKGGGALGVAAMGPCQKGAHKVCQIAIQFSEFILDFSIQLSK